MDEMTLRRMQSACSRVDNGRSPHPTYIQEMADEADRMVAEVTVLAESKLDSLSAAMRANSERWFPGLHDGSNPVPLAMFYALGLAGEAGEVANLAKKMVRGVDDDVKLRADMATEIVDTLTYLLLLADEMEVDIIPVYTAKVHLNNKRWGG